MDIIFYSFFCCAQHDFFDVVLQTNNELTKSQEVVQL